MLDLSLFKDFDSIVDFVNLDILEEAIKTIVFGTRGIMPKLQDH
jgi:hypothetical protein